MTGARLRDLIRQDGGLLLPGAANALTARVVEDIGYQAAYVTGAGVTNTYLGLPDLGFVSLTDVAAHVAAMAEVVDIPLVVDADTGYGNALNVHHAVRVLERAGAAAIQLEDQVAPKRCGHFDGQQVIDTAEAVQKIHAATDARRDEATVIIARTDARAAHGLSAALDRAAALAEAGADVLFVEGLRTPDELRTVGDAVPGVPKLANIVEGGRTPMLPRAQLHAMGFAIVLYANAALQAAVHGMRTVLGDLRANGTLAGSTDRLTPFAERQRLVRKDHYDDMAQTYRAP
jgi:2-methylisocitrate lyase-like PEP mutase family enzyme